MAADRVAHARALLAAGPLATKLEQHRPLGPLTTYRVGGPAALFLTVTTHGELRAVAEVVRATGVDVLVVGKGSNLLVADAGFDGVALVLTGAFADVDLLPGARVRAGAAAPLPVVARKTAAAGLAGFEWAVGVPGTIGGAVRMNAGGHGSDLAASLVEVRLVALRDGPALVTRDASQLALAYRSSALADTDVVVDALVQLAPADPDACARTIDEIVRWRREHQPGGQNAGSVFTNPPGDAAGRLIDTAGAKGLRVGTAQVSPKHANFIIADEGGSADDVYRLMGEVADLVECVHGVRLHAETRCVGFDVAQPGGRP